MKKILLLCLFVLFSFNSFAGLLIEPLVGMSFSKKISFDGGNDYSSGTGYAFGGRLGYQSGWFQIGGDLLQSSMDMSDSDFGENVKTKEYGAFVGLELPILLRLYGTYIFSANGETEIDSTNVVMKGGSGFKIGAGFTLLPFLDINADYRSIAFENQDFEAYMLSISLPFDLF